MSYGWNILLNYRVMINLHYYFCHISPIVTQNPEKRKYPHPQRQGLWGYDQVYAPGNSGEYHVIQCYSNTFTKDMLYLIGQLLLGVWIVYVGQARDGDTTTSIS